MQRQVREFRGTLTWAFLAFILACGVGHLAEACTVWWPAYRAVTLLHIVTSCVSVAAMMYLGSLLPRAGMRLAAIGRVRQLASDVASTRAQRDAAFDFSRVGMSWVALNGSWIKVNDALCHILGRSREQLLATTFQEITHPDDLGADLDLLDLLRADEAVSYQMEKRYLRPSGDIVWTRLTVSGVRDRRGRLRHYMSQIEDITEIKRLRGETEPRPSWVTVRDSNGHLVREAVH